MLSPLVLKGEIAVEEVAVDEVAAAVEAVEMEIGSVLTLGNFFISTFDLLFREISLNVRYSGLIDFLSFVWLVSLSGFCFNQVVNTYDMLGINNSLNSFETCCLEQIIFSSMACFMCAS